MPFYLVTPIVQMVLFTILIPIALKGRIRNGSRFLFITLLVCFILWGAVVLLMRSAADTGSALIWAKFISVSRLSLVIILFHFAVRYSGSVLHKWVLPSLWFIFTGFIILSLTGLIVSFTVPSEYGFTPQPGTLFLFVTIPALVLVGTAFYYLYKAARQAVYSRERNRDIYFLTGIACLSIGNAVNFLTIFNVPMFPGSFVGSIIFFILSCFALIRFRPFDVQTIIRTGVSHLIVAGIVALVYIGALLLASTMVNGVLPVWIHAVMLIVLVITLRLIWDKVGTLVERWFLGKRYRYIKELRKFSAETHDVSDLQKICDNLVSLLQGALQSRFVSLVMLTDSGEYDIVAQTGNHAVPITFQRTSVLAEWLITCEECFYIRDIDLVPQLQSLSTLERDQLQLNEIELIVPLKATLNDLTGMILIGPKISGGIFSDEEMDSVYRVADRVSIELENARLYSLQMQVRDELQKQDELRTEFLHSIAHELKTPLTSLLSSSELLQEDIDVMTISQRDRIINNIQRSASSMDRRVSELLDFARSRTSGLQLKPAPVVLNRSFSDVLDRMLPIFEDRKQALKVEIEDPLPETNADVDKLEQVLINILSNASKYSPGECEIVVRAKCMNGNILVEVEDFAQIIDEPDREKIFEPYYRAKSSTGMDRRPGLGLGLAISKEIIEGHNGRIWVDTCEGKGNVFAFSLPVHQTA